MAARAAASQSFSGREVMGSPHHRTIDIAYRSMPIGQSVVRIEGDPTFMVV
jgi:hypothetical protein